jgi:cytochrome P450
LTFSLPEDESTLARALAPVPDAPADGHVISDPTLISEILRSRDFRVVDYAWHYDAIAKRTGLDFDASIKAMAAMPLANEDNAHRQLRSRSARAISASWHEATDDLREYIGERVRLTFARPGEIELVGDLCFPIFSHLYAFWSGLALDEEPGVSQVFCGRMSLNRRRQVDDRLAGLDAALHRSATRIPGDVALSFAILASDALVGSLALSLWDAFSTREGQRITNIRFPEALPASAVPYVDRIAGSDIELRGVAFVKGQRVRLMLGDAEPDPNGARDLFFGAGRHLCLGKPMTEMIWTCLVRSLSRVQLRLTPQSLVMRRPDHVFRYPQSATVRLHV